jgi:ribonuclease D
MDNPLDEKLDLPNYQGIAAADVILIRSAHEIEMARAAFMATDALGFDTESKPTFFKGQHSDGPHLIQLATETKVFLFPVNSSLQLDLIKEVLENDQIVKVGFGLGDDIRRLQMKLGIEVQNVVDLARKLRQSKGGDVGAKAALALYLGMKMQKSKKTSTSNWAAAELSERQILYAANDAQVALLVYKKWLEKHHHIPKTHQL